MGGGRANCSAVPVHGYAFDCQIGVASDERTGLSIESELFSVHGNSSLHVPQTAHSDVEGARSAEGRPRIQNQLVGKLQGRTGARVESARAGTKRIKN